MSTFKQLGLNEQLLRSLSDLKFETPTEIQSKAIPILLNGATDFVGLAQTGTGKTAAFGLPLLQLIDSKYDYTQALILSPTRELCKQITEQLKNFSKYDDNLNVFAVYGGEPIHFQLKKLKKTQHVIVATPGRLIDLLKRKAVNLSQLGILVLDEADEMLNMGFKEDLDTILTTTTEDKLTWLFSATMPKYIKKIASEYMDEPQEVKIDPKNEVNKNISHQYCCVKSSDKTEALCRILDKEVGIRAIIFCRTKRDTQDLAEYLLKRNYKADSIHGDLPQPQRERVMKRFRDQELSYLVATDVAARGIDVNDLNYVFHYALPEDYSYYTHRSGRTARAGKKGISLALATPAEMRRLKQIANVLKIEFEKVLIPKASEINAARTENWAMDLLSYSAKPQLSEEDLDQVFAILGGLSKEELVLKLINKEFQQSAVHSEKNLNANENSRGRSGSRSKERRKGESRSKSGAKSESSSRSSNRRSSRRKQDDRKRRGGGSGSESKGRSSRRFKGKKRK